MNRHWYVKSSEKTNQVQLLNVCFLPSVESSCLRSYYTVVECNCIALEGMALSIPEPWHFGNLHSHEVKVTDGIRQCVQAFQ